MRLFWLLIDAVVNLTRRHFWERVNRGTGFHLQFYTNTGSLV